jgi:hypothetical protein
MTEPEWMEEFEEHPIRELFGSEVKAIKIIESDVGDELLTECVKNYIVAEVATGYFITHEHIEEHQEVIKEHGMEAYLRKRLEVLDDQ